MNRRASERREIKPCSSLQQESKAPAGAPEENWQGREVDFPREATLHGLFAEQVVATPGATALIEGTTEISYSGLNARMNAIARLLRAHGVQPGARVGIALDRSADAIAAILAIWHLGGAMVPLDPGNPADRLAFISSDAKLSAIVSRSGIAQKADFQNAILIDEATYFETEATAGIEQAPTSAESPCYIAYTSGSTGVPKGVLLAHRAMMNRFNWMWRTFPFEQGEVMCHKTTLSFVDCLWEMFGPLLKGVPVVIIDRETLLSPEQFFETLGRHGVTRLLVVPSLLSTILDAGLDISKSAPSLRWLFTSGERISASLAGTFLAEARDVRLVNLYGSSEIAADVTYEIVRAVEDGDVPIGRPIDNSRVYVLDEKLEPMPVGEVGELYVGGEVLAAGYHDRPALTAERFLPDPFSGVAGGRMFRTGDLVRWLPDGRLAYHGRRDHQVKIRGMRIELGEIESRLVEQSGVREAAVLCKVDPGGEQRLVAFVTANAEMPDQAEIKLGLGRQLPDYMIPWRIIELAEMPLNANGKTDRLALERYEIDRVHAPDSEGAAETALQQDLREIWARVLGSRHFGMDDNFFELGGHSLMAVRLFSEVRKSYGTELPISALLAHPTLRSLSEHIAEQLHQRDTIASRSVSDFETEPWDTTVVVHPGPDGSDAPPLFMVGGVGGNVNDLYDLGGEIGKQRALIGLQTRGIMGRRMHDTIEEVAEDHLNNIRRHQPNGPYRLAGYSGGSLAAFEMARQLEAAGEAACYVGIIDVPAPGFSVSSQMSIVGRLSEEIRMLRQYGGRAFWTRVRGRLTDLSVTSYFMPDLARFQELVRKMNEAYDKYRPQPYGGDILLYVSDSASFQHQLLRTADPDLGWRSLVRGRVHRREFQADHLSMHKGDAAAILAAQIETDIEAASGGAIDGRGG